MKNYMQALKTMTTNSNILTTCSEIPQNYAKSLFNQNIVLKEKSSGIRFQALVIDYCFEDQKGIIVKFLKTDSKKLDSRKLCQKAENNPDKYVELDCRDIFYGKLFELSETLH